MLCTLFMPVSEKEKQKVNLRFTCTVTTPWNIFLSEWPPETSTLHFFHHNISKFGFFSILVLKQKIKKKEKKKEIYASRNIPASLKHLTLVELGKSSLN